MRHRQKLDFTSDPRVEIYVSHFGAPCPTGIVGFRESLTWGALDSGNIFQENPAWKGKTVEQLEAEKIIPKPTPPPKGWKRWFPHEFRPA